MDTVAGRIAAGSLLALLCAGPARSAEGRRLFISADTFSSANLAGVRLNGTSVTEGAWNAALLAYYGVPVLAVSGDEAAVKPVQSLVPGIEEAARFLAVALNYQADLQP